MNSIHVFNDTDINGLAGAVSERLSAGGFLEGTIGNHENDRVAESQVQAAAADDPGAQAVATTLGGLAVMSDPSIPPGTVRVVLADDYAGPGSGLDGTLPTAQSVQDMSAEVTDEPTPLVSPVITAGSDDTKCVN